jgi:hypothetical protein
MVLISLQVVPAGRTAPEDASAPASSAPPHAESANPAPPAAVAAAAAASVRGHEGESGAQGGGGSPAQAVSGGVYYYDDTRDDDDDPGATAARLAGDDLSIAGRERCYICQEGPREAAYLPCGASATLLSSHARAPTCGREAAWCKRLVPGPVG